MLLDKQTAEVHGQAAEAVMKLIYVGDEACFFPGPVFIVHGFCAAKTKINAHLFVHLHFIGC